MIVPLTPVRFLYRGVDLFGKKVGIVSGAKRFTYAQFGERCEHRIASVDVGEVAFDDLPLVPFRAPSEVAPHRVDRLPAERPHELRRPPPVLVRPGRPGEVDAQHA